MTSEKQIKFVNEMLVCITLSVCLSLISGVLFGLNIIQGRKYNNLKKEAISLGYAQHDPINGYWQWKTNSTERK